jgi:chloramphenicol-sensitive protein RarD
VAVYGEAMSTARWIAFGVIWLALVVFSVDSLRHRQRQLTRLRVDASSV